MLIRTVKAAAALTSVLVLAACGADSSDDAGDAGRNLTREPKLQGAWISACDTFGPLNLSGRASYGFEPLRYRKKVALFAEGNCTNAQAEIRYEGEFKVGNSDDLADGLNRVDLTPKKAIVRAITQEGADALNRAGLCGITDYRVDVSRDVTALAKEQDCLQEKPDATQYDVYKLDDKRLQFGSAYLLGAPVDAKRRPTNLNQRVFEPTEKWE